QDRARQAGAVAPVRRAGANLARVRGRHWHPLPGSKRPRRDAKAPELAWLVSKMDPEPDRNTGAPALKAARRELTRTLISRSLIKMTRPRQPGPRNFCTREGRG